MDYYKLVHYPLRDHNKVKLKNLKSMDYCTAMTHLNSILHLSSLFNKC